MKKPEPDFGRDELFEALRRTLEMREEGSGMTTKEIQEALSAQGIPIHERKLKLALARVKGAGRLIVVREYRESLDGVWRTVPTYSLAPTEPTTE